MTRFSTFSARLVASYGLFTPVKRIATPRSFSTQAPYVARFVPVLPKEAKVIIPISMTRYDGDLSKRRHYDQEISALLSYTASCLKKGDLNSVEVISTAGLQRINWGSEKTQEIEAHFLTTHQAMLSQQTHVHTWDGFTDKLGAELYATNYELIKAASAEGSLWYSLMLKTSDSVRINSDIEKSLEYQRREYASILSMKSIYSHIAYLGKTSPAWSHLYQEHEGLPLFTRAIVEKIKNKAEISTADANACVNMAFNSIEGILVNENFPKKDKVKLADMVTSLFRAYIPKEPSARDETSLASTETIDYDKNNSKKKGPGGR